MPNRLIFTIAFSIALLRTRFFVNCSSKRITLGVLLPFESERSFLADNRQQARYYAGMIPYVINIINNDPNLLANHTLDYIWKDTECETNKALLGIVEQWWRKVDVFIGLGCDCEEPARLTSALKLPAISSVSYTLTPVYSKSSLSLSISRVHSEFSLGVIAVSE